MTNPSTPPAADTICPLDADQLLAADLLTHIKLKPRSLAEKLASEHPFARIRECVSHWWPNRQSVGGIFMETPGVVIYWLNHFDISSIPPIHPDFYATGLYHDFRPASEIQAEAAALTQAAQDLATWYTTNFTNTSPPTSATGIYEIYTKAWDQLLRDLKHRLPVTTYLDFISKNLILTHVQDPPPQLTFTITVQNPKTRDWIQNQLTTMFQRTLRQQLNQPVTVAFQS